MTQTDFTGLYHSRCIEVEPGKWKPHFWVPQPIKKTPLTLFGTSDLHVRDEWLVAETISRCLALNLYLELPVGEFISAATKRDLPDLPRLMPLLKSNIADEARHYKGFQIAAETYSIPDDDLTEAEMIANAWERLMDKHHPILLAAALEIRIFLVVLGCMRLFGGLELARVARRISEDEARHTKTNRSVAIELGYDGYSLPSDIEHLAADTLDWLFSDLQLPGKEVFNDRLMIDYNFLKKSSDQLLAYGNAPELDQLVFCVDDAAPFEVDNAMLYDREVA